MFTSFKDVFHHCLPPSLSLSLPPSLSLSIFSTTSASCLSIYSELCCVTDRLVFHQTDWKIGLHSQNDRSKQIVSAGGIHLLYKCEVCRVLARRSQMLCKMENSNICFMSSPWSRLWFACDRLFFYMSEPVDLWGTEAINCCYLSKKSDFLKRRTLYLFCNGQSCLFIFAGWTLCDCQSSNGHVFYVM